VPLLKGKDKGGGVVGGKMHWSDSAVFDENPLHRSYSSHNASEHAEQLYTASTVTGTGQHDIRPPAQLHAAAAVTGEYSHHHFTSTITVGGTAYNSVHGLFLTHAPRRAAL